MPDLRNRLPALSVLLAPLLVASLAFGAGKSVDLATPAEKTEAGNLYSAAMADFDRGDFQKALAGFHDSYDHVRSPNSHFMIARTLAKIGENAEAYTELEAVIAEAEALNGRYADTVSAARAKLEEIRPRVGLVVITLENAPKGTEVLIGADRLDPGQFGQPVPVLPGKTSVSAVVPDGASYPRDVTVAAGTTATVAIDVAADASAARVPIAPPAHPRHRLELEAHFIGETLGPKTETRGAGVGALAALEVLPTGVLGSSDSFALASGVDWSATSTDPHFWIPVLVQWNLWVFPDFSIRLEPGAAFLVGAGTRVTPALYAGVRYRVYRHLYVTGRVGIPEATIGASLFL